MISGAVQIGSAIARAKGITQQQPTRDRTYTTRRNVHIPWPVIVIGIVLLILLLRGGGGGGFLAGMILGNLLGSGGRDRDGWGGGGFGGGGGGGGFGGFGGGDSGGGGASGSW
jgi:uncharacterized protein